MKKNFCRSFTNHLKHNLVLYTLICIFLIFGIVLGSVGAKSLDSNQTGSLGDYLNNFVSSFSKLQVEPEVLASASLVTNIKLLLLIWFLGLTIIGVPIIFLAIMLKGFYLGFTVGFLIQEKGIQGILFTAIALLPQNIFNLPALVVSGVIAASFSIWLLQGRFKNPNEKLSQQFFAYTLVFCSLGLVIACGSFLEGYLTPWLLRAALALF